MRLIVPRWATDEIFWDLEARGLTMYGQMTAGSWVYIGTQGILQGTYETLASLARLEFGAADLPGRWMLTLGPRGDGRRPTARGHPAGRRRPRRRRATPGRSHVAGAFHYLDVEANDLDDALPRIRAAVAARRPLSVGLCANAADVYPEIVYGGRSSRTSSATRPRPTTYA